MITRRLHEIRDILKGAHKKMIKLLPIFILLFSSIAFADDRYETNVPDVYIKNLECKSTWITFNLVNKSNKTIRSISLHIFDKDGDPIDIKTIGTDILLPAINIPPQTGLAQSISVDCKNLKKFGFSVN